MDAGQAVELIKSRLSLREVVSRYVALKPAGRGRWKGLCPFHQEKTPSFYVDEEKGLFYCFGCKAGGDLFAFVQRAEGLDFPEALERLAEEAGVELPGGRPRKGAGSSSRSWPWPRPTSWSTSTPTPRPWPT